MSKPKSGAPLKALFAGTLGALTGGGLSALGFNPGTETTIGGLDGGTVRDTVIGAVTVGSFFLPALGPVANILKSLTNHKDVEAVIDETAAQLEREKNQNERLAAIEARLRIVESQVT